MIYLTTGQPGAGKTLWTIFYVKQLAERENRTVYFSGINDLKLPWVELDDPRQWHRLPPGSIIVLDEAQRLFRPRATGSAVPDYVQALETHRHHGYDIFVVTQHPMLIESNVRRLIGRHWHVQRTFGLHRATVHEFHELRQEPDKSREGSIRHEWSYPAEVFNYYKSAELHTHKRSVPVRVWLLFALPPILGMLGYSAYSMLLTHEQQDQQPVADGGGKAEPADTVGFRSREIGFIESHSPRIPGLLHTAPRYDEITRPVSAPKPVACVATKSRCRCYTSQATPLNVPGDLCAQIVASGWFDDSQESLYSHSARENDMPSVAPTDGGFDPTNGGLSPTNG